MLCNKYGCAETTFCAILVDQTHLPISRTWVQLKDPTAGVKVRLLSSSLSICEAQYPSNDTTAKDYFPMGQFVVTDKSRKETNNEWGMFTQTTQI